MKKIILTTILICAGLMAIPKVSMAQTFAVGPKVGFNASNFMGDDIDREKFRKGIQFGAFFMFAPNEWFSVQPEIVFDQRGSQETIFNNVRREININYLSIPVALNFRIPVAEIFYPKVMVGPYTSFALSENQRLIGGNSSVVFTQTDIKRIDFGGFAGAGLDIQKNNFFFSFDIRYLFGSMDVSKEEDIEFRNTQISTNAAIGYKF